MCDIFGRHAALQASIVTMLIGSAICTGAPLDAFPALLLGRAIQGIACAGITVIVRVILADKVSLRESSVNWTIFSFVSGIAFGIGPVVGGFLTRVDWRWCFGINLPIGVAGIILVALIIRSELLGPRPVPELDENTETGRRTTFVFRLRTIDVWGQLFFLIGFGLVILSLTWAGATYAWNSAAVLVSLIAGLLMVGIWAIWQNLMSPGHMLGERWHWKRPMIQWEILADRNVGLLFYTSFATGMAQFAVRLETELMCRDGRLTCPSPQVFYFCSIYFAVVKVRGPFCE
jgi:MFS family permease